jgi:hypothetical protein
MEQDFHYYTIYHLSVLAGFSKSDAQTIAYASQYVDDATESEPIRPFEDQYFDTARTAHYNLEGFTWNVLPGMFKKKYTYRFISCPR